MQDSSDPNQKHVWLVYAMWTGLVPEVGQPYAQVMLFDELPGEEWWGKYRELRERHGIAEPLTFVRVPVCSTGDRTALDFTGTTITAPLSEAQTPTDHPECR